MKKILIIIISFNLCFNHVFSTEPDIFVQSTVNRASEILSKNISKEEKMNALKNCSQGNCRYKRNRFLFPRFS